MLSKISKHQDLYDILQTYSNILPLTEAMSVSEPNISVIVSTYIDAIRDRVISGKFNNIPPGKCVNLHLKDIKQQFGIDNPLKSWCTDIHFILMSAEAIRNNVEGFIDNETICIEDNKVTEAEITIFIDFQEMRNNPVRYSDKLKRMMNHEITHLYTYWRDYTNNREDKIYTGADSMLYLLDKKIKAGQDLSYTEAYVLNTQMRKMSDIFVNTMFSDLPADVRAKIFSTFPNLKTIVQTLAYMFYFFAEDEVISRRNEMYQHFVNKRDNKTLNIASDVFYQNAVSRLKRNCNKLKQLTPLLRAESEIEKNLRKKYVMPYVFSIVQGLFKIRTDNMRDIYEYFVKLTEKEIRRYHKIYAGVKQLII